MTKEDYDQLFRQLSNLLLEAPCCNKSCVGSQICSYGVNGCYGEECAIETVSAEVLYRYQQQFKD